jgi:hypothetical protein
VALRQVGEKRGHESHTEWVVPGTNHPADATWKINGHWHIFEVIVACETNLISHLETCFNRPRDLVITYSQHCCSRCRKYFNADLSDVAVPSSLYTHRVVALAVRLVVEDGLPYRAASWHLWRDHRVFVPFATVQNWVEAGGKKGRSRHHRGLP